MHFKEEKVGWIADSKIRSGKRVECKNQILHAIAYFTEPYYVYKSHDTVVFFLFFWVPIKGASQKEIESENSYFNVRGTEQHQCTVDTGEGVLIFFWILS